MKKGDVTTKAIGLAIAGVLAGSRLATAIQDTTTKPADKTKPAAGEDKSAKDKTSASSDKHVCKGMNSCKGKGWVMSTSAEVCTKKGGKPEKTPTKAM